MHFHDSFVATSSMIKGFVLYIAEYIWVCNFFFEHFCEGEGSPTGYRRQTPPVVDVTQISGWLPEHATRNPDSHDSPGRLLTLDYDGCAPRWPRKLFQDYALEGP